ncbi:hypothetical protein [Nocardioides cynanchi]|uniref:hypothetical protein n=1 Tax=Nocardioides cynanchi TaxID=2558918 RepID=UPI001245BA4B|nr:hypothetical protein [Nocardioides cynanchi]
MRTRRRFRRTIAVTASAGLAAGLAWLPAGPASAAVVAQFAAQGSANTSSSCTLTTGDDQPSSPGATFSSGTQSQSVDLAATFTNTGNSADTVSMTGHYATTMTVAKQGGDLSKLVATGKGSVGISAAQGSASACLPQAFVDLFGFFEFTESHSGWIYITRNTVPKQGIALAAVADEATSRAIAFDVWQGAGSSAVSRGFLTPGTFGGQIAVGLTAGNVPPIFPFKRTPQSSIAVTFHRSGSAFAATAGSAGRFVKFPGSISCSGHKATLTWKSGASKVASGSFLVNGKTKASDSNPRSGRQIVLRHLSSTADNTITAKLSLAGGGHASASRTYVPCQG